MRAGRPSRAAAEDASTTVLGEGDRLTADIDRLVGTRAALDEPIAVNTGFRRPGAA